MEKALKKEQKKWKRELRRDLRQRRLYHPVLLAVYAFAWRTLYRFCMYGGVRRRVPVLGACGLLFLIYWLWVQAELLFYQKRSRKQLYTELEIEKNEFRLPDGGRYSFGEVQWYRREKERIALFLKGHRFLWLDTEKLTGKNRELLIMKLTQRGLFARQFWKVPVALALVLVTVAGCGGVAWSGMKYNGKLSWKIDEWRNSRQVTLTHNNLYRDGVLGIFLDLAEKTKLPEHLCLVNAVQIDFQPDGTIQELYLFLAGYDSEYRYTGSYLVDYRDSRSGKMTLWLDGAVSDETYQEERDIQTLVEGLNGDLLRTELETERAMTYRLSYRGGGSFTVTCREKQAEEGGTYEEDNTWKREYRIGKSGMAERTSDGDFTYGTAGFRLWEKADTAGGASDEVSAAFK